MNYLLDNAGTIAVAIIIALIISAIVIKLIRDKKKGKCAGCGCGCTGCPESEGGHGSAHKRGGKS